MAAIASGAPRCSSRCCVCWSAFAPPSARADHAVPEPIAEAIGRMARMLRFFEHGDGGLALFNDSNDEEDWLIDMALARAIPA